MGLIKITSGRRSEPMKSALCKAPVGIVVAKPPAPIPVTVVARPVQQVDSQTRPEHLRPLSPLQVPAIRGGFNRNPFVASPKIATLKRKRINAKLPKKGKGPKPRILTPEDVALRECLADELVKLLRYRIRSASKMTLVCHWSGSMPMGAITAGLRLAVQRGDVLKDQSHTPSRYSIAKPLTTVESNEWITGPGAIVVGIPLIESGWTTQL